MSTINGKLTTPLADDTERIEKVEKKVNSVVVSLRELIDYSDRENIRIKQTIAKVSDLDNRLQALSNQKQSGTKVLIGMNFLVLIATFGLFAGNFLQINPDKLDNWQTVIELFKTEQK